MPGVLVISKKLPSESLEHQAIAPAAARAGFALEFPDEWTGLANPLDHAIVLGVRHLKRMTRIRVNTLAFRQLVRALRK